MLTDETRRALRRAGVGRDEVWCRVCSRCQTPTGHVTGEHPLDDKIRKIKKKIAENPGNRALDSKRHWLESIRHRTSRCCGANYAEKLMDPQMAKWERWLSRWDEVRRFVFPLVLRSNPRISDDDALRFAIAFMRKEYGPLARMRDDDFIVLSHLWGRGDRAITKYLEIFRREEELQKSLEPLEQQVPAAAICDLPL